MTGSNIIECQFKTQQHVIRKSDGAVGVVKSANNDVYLVWFNGCETDLCIGDQLEKA